MQPLYDEFSNWINGVTTSPNADMLPLSWSPRGRNTNLVNIGQQTAQVGARKGPATGNVIPITGSPVILGTYQLKRLDGSKTHLMVSDNGRLDKYNTDTTTSVINATAFTAGTKYPSFVTVNNICIIANGTDLKKTDGTTVWAVGITRPAAPTAAVAAGGSMSTGAWDVALTYLNSVTGEESSLSDFTTVTTTGGNLKINVSWSTPSDTQVDYVRVYLRKQTLGANVYLAIAGVTPAVNATYLAYPVASVLATVVDISDAIFQALTTIAPSTYSNNPPATTLQFPVWHNQRLFLFDTGNAYYSNIRDGAAHPESFDALNNIQQINPGDGDVIMGAISAFDRLYIFKKYAMWQITGYDPSSWTVTRVSDKHGCGSHRTIVLAGGQLYWWSNTSLGPLTLTGPGVQPIEFGKELIATTVSDTAINTLVLPTAVAEVDEANDLVLFSVPLSGATTRNSLIIPFNYRVKRFVSDGWNPMDVSCFAVVEDTASTKNVYIGGYSGQIFKWWQATNDGVPATTTGSGTVTGLGTSTTLVDSAATFSTTGGKLVERYVYHVPAMGAVQRRRITGNTGTTLTVTPAWGQTLLLGDTYIVGGIDWQLDTPWSVGSTAFLKKRFEFLFIEASSQQNNAVITADVFTRDNRAVPAKTLTFAVGNLGATYGTAIYGVNSRYASTAPMNKRKSIGRTGKTYSIRLRQLQADKQIVLERIAVQGSVLGTKT